jgi:hypothetical protein
MVPAWHPILLGLCPLASFCLKIFVWAELVVGPAESCFVQNPLMMRLFAVFSIDQDNSLGDLVSGIYAPGGLLPKVDAIVACGLSFSLLMTC